MKARNILPKGSTVMQQIKIDLWHNDEVLDWSIEINGLRHEHVTSEVAETLAECAMIVAEKPLTRPALLQ
jgi:hypothetical protein